MNLARAPIRRKARHLARAILNHLLESGCYDTRRHTLSRTQNICAFHRSRGQRVFGIRHQDSASDLSPDHRTPRTFQRVSSSPQRLGLRQEIIDAAKAEINPEDLRADKLLDDIRKERNRTSRERQKLEKARDQAGSANKGNRKATWKRSKMNAVMCWPKPAPKANWKWRSSNETSTRLKSQLKKAKQPLEAIKTIEEKMEEIEEKVEATG